MAGKPKQMSQIKQLLRLHQQGESKKVSPAYWASVKIP